MTNTIQVFQAGKWNSAFVMVEEGRVTNLCLKAVEDLYPNDPVRAIPECETVYVAR